MKNEIGTTRKGGPGMEVHGLDKLKEFGGDHPDSSKRLNVWLDVMRGNGYDDFVELKNHFPQADYDKPFTIFNLGRNYRLIAIVGYFTKQVSIEHIFTHQEYDRWNKTRRK